MRKRRVFLAALALSAPLLMRTGAGEALAAGICWAVESGEVAAATLTVELGLEEGMCAPAGRPDAADEPAAPTPFPVLPAGETAPA